MHKLFLFVLLLLLGINGVFVWQNVKKNNKTATAVCQVSTVANLRTDNIITFVLSGAFVAIK